MRPEENGVQPMFGGEGRGRGSIMFGVFRVRVQGFRNEDCAFASTGARRGRRWNGSNGRLGYQTTAASGTLI